jgi:hypothetical protein
MEVHLASCDLTQAEHRGPVLGPDEGVGTLHDLASPRGGKDDQREPVFFALETIFDSYASHVDELLNQMKVP